MSKKIVVYTALFGNHSGLVEQKNFKGMDFICYTNRKDITSNTWKIISTEPHIDNDPTRTARYYKLNPHKHLPQKYDISVWVDANILILQNIYETVQKWTQDHIVACFDHNQTVLDPRDCTYEEVKAIIEIGEETGHFKDDPNVMQKQMEHYKKEGFPAHYGLIFSAILVRKHNHSDTIKLMNEWWNTLSEGSKRDQLSFDYNVWKLGLKDKIKILPGDLREGNPWFRMIRHRKKFWWKVFRIRWKKKLGILKMKNRETEV